MMAAGGGPGTGVKGTGSRRCGMYIQWNIIQPLKKNETLPFAAMWLDLEIIMLSEISQGKTNTVYHFYVESKKRIQMNLYTKQTQRHRKQIYGYQKGGWGGELGV